MRLISNITIVLLICHVLGDFQLQTEEMADVKTKSLSALAKHLLVHDLVLAVFPILLFGWRSLSEVWLLSLLVWLSHCIVDVAKFYLKSWEALSREVVYIVDQLVHIILIILLSEYL